MFTAPSELKYTKTHEWVGETDGILTVGLTDYAQDAMGDIVFVGLPEEGDAVSAGESFADVESVKAVSEVISPVTGIISAVNEDLLDQPGLVNDSPYAAWLIQVSGWEETEDLMDADSYLEFCGTLGA